MSKVAVIWLASLWAFWTQQAPPLAEGPADETGPHYT